MSKYIDTEKLIAKLEKLKNGLKLSMSKFYYATNYKEWAAELNGYNTVLSIITYLQQEQLEEALSKPELPSNLDEVAEKWVENNCFDCDCVGENRTWDAFKAGAEWMAGQGESHETEIVSRVTGNGLLPAVTCLVNKSYKEGDKVVVQIRKK